MSHISIENNTGSIHYKSDIKESYIGSRRVWEKRMDTTLLTGPELKAIFTDGAQTFKRSETPPDSSVVYQNISEDRDNSVITWYDTITKTQYWYSNKETIYLNPQSNSMFEGETFNTISMVGFDSSKVVNMTSMFSSHQILNIEGMQNFDTSNVTSMQMTFASCGLIESIDLSGWNTSNVTTMQSLFSGCKKLFNLNISSFNTSNVTNMRGMFENCNAMVSLDLSHFDMSKVTTTKTMFRNCTALTTITYGDKFTNYSIDDTMMMFNATNAPKPTWTGGTWDADGTFVPLPAPTLLPGAEFGNKLRNIKAGKQIIQFIRSNTPPAASIVPVDISKAQDKSIVMWMEAVSGFNINVKWYSEHRKVQTDAVAGYMFSSLGYITLIDLTGWDTSNSTSMESMFNGCSALKNTLDLSGFNTINVTTMKNMFFNNGGPTINYGDNFVNTNTTDFTNMMQYCASNKPNWTNGTWNTGGTFIKNA